MPEIIINNFQQGIAQSPHLGFADIRNVDVHSIPGVAQIAPAASSIVASASMGLPQWFVTNPEDPRMIFTVTYNGSAQKVFKSTDYGDTWTQITGHIVGAAHGLSFWKNHLIVTGNSALDTLRSPYTSSDWSGSLSSGIDFDGDWHPMIPGQDDILYGGSGRYIFSLQEVSGQTFQGGTAATYTITPRALDLPQNNRVKCLSELGNNLMIGTFQGSATTDNFSISVASIFPWDRVSDTFNLPVRIGEVGVHQLLSANNVLYVSAGIDGNYFVSDIASFANLFSIPDSISETNSTHYFTNNPDAISEYRGGVLFGSSGSTYDFGSQGVWYLKDGVLTLNNIVSINEDGSGTGNIEIGSVHKVKRNEYLIGWSYAGSNYGIDKVGSNKYTGYKARIDSQYFEIGSEGEPAVFQELEFELAKPFSTGQGIRFSFRTDLDSEFSNTEPYTFDYSTHGAIQGGIATLQSEVKRGIQVRIEMTTPAGTASTPQLKSVKIR